MILDKFPKVFWINLDASVKRKKYMEDLLNKYRLNHLRIQAVDGMTNSIELAKICVPNKLLTRSENACTCSHLQAIKYFMDNVSDERIIIFEDDVSFDFLPFIPFNWSEFEKKLPKNYEIIQLAVTYESNDITNKLIKITPNMKYYCSTAYLINKIGASKLLERYFSKDFGKIDLSNQEHAAADRMICSTDATYSIPIFSYLTKESIIHPFHLHIHNKSKKRQLEMWKRIDPKKFNKNVYFSTWFS